MHERPPDLTDSEVAEVLRAHWSLPPASLNYVPAGFGGYHWAAMDVAGSRWFVTVNLVSDDTGLEDLRAAMAATAQLAEEGLDFVVAPVRAADGRLAYRIRTHFALMVFPFVAGIPGRWGGTMTDADRADVTRMLAALHQAEPGPGLVPARPADLSNRDWLRYSEQERGRPWRRGPYEAAAEELVSGQAASLQAALEVFDALAARVAAESRPPVVTHGEPHCGNLIRRGDRFLLIDWDTMGLAPPERDLWWVLSDTCREADLYARLTGREVSETAVALYRLRWDLEDIGLLFADLMSARERNQDTETGWAGLREAVNRVTDIGSLQL